MTSGECGGGGDAGGAKEGGAGGMSAKPNNDLSKAQMGISANAMCWQMPYEDVGCMHKSVTQ